MAYFPNMMQKNIFSAITFDDQLGNRGENTMSFLEKKGLTIHVEKELCVDGSEQDYLV